MSARAPAADRARHPELCRRFIQALGQSVKLVSLYKANHPVPVSAMQEAWHILHDLFAETGWPELTLALVAGRWLANEAVIAESAQAHELLAMVFRSHAISSLTFLPEARAFEFASLCEMAATPPNQAYQTDAGEYLKERGVRHIRANVEEYVRRRSVQPHASPLVQNPLARLRVRPKPARSVAPAPAPERGFGAFIKDLIDESVQDPAERAKLYAESLQLVELAIARHVSEATHKLLAEKQAILNERARAEHVLTAVADGKVVVDKEGKVRMMDPAAEEIVGRNFGEVAGKPILEALDTSERMVTLAKDLVIPENGPVSEEVRVAGDEEALAAFRRSMARVEDEHGRLVGTCAAPPYLAKYRETLRMQEDFIAGITHDLKGPLTSICSTLELLNQKARAKLSTDEAFFLDVSLRNSRTLGQMIDEVLDFSKIRSGAMSARLVPVPVAAAIRESVEALTPWAESKGLRLEFEGAEEAGRLPAVLADHGRLVQILNNLLSNAIKFTDQGGAVHVRAAPGAGEREGTVVVSVLDTGRGIAPPDQKRIFEKFTQLASAGGKREGVGLGLAIVGELVSLHRGEVWLESEPGKGSQFSFSLPLAPTGGP